MSRNCVWVLEQPAGSILVRHKRFEWMCNVVAFATLLNCSNFVVLFCNQYTLTVQGSLVPCFSQVYEIYFWMMLHGSPTSKRTVAYSNMQEVTMLDRGRLSKAVKDKNTSKTLTRPLLALIIDACIKTCMI